MSKKDQLTRIANEAQPCFKWECPCCAEVTYSEDDNTEQEFINQLYKQGVRFKVMKYMQGVFCESCYSDPEVQDSSL